MEIVSITKITMFLILQILIFLNVSPYLVHCAFTRLPLPLTASGPESAAFDTKGGGPYTGVGDGRVFKYQGPNIGFTEFAFTSPNRTKITCDGINDPISKPTCGRPFGLAFYNKTGELYITDTYNGLLVVRPSGGLARRVVTSFEDKPFSFLHSLSIDQERGIIYFVDSGDIYKTRNRTEIVTSRDTTGRLFKYNMATKKVTLMLRGLSGPAGVAVSKDKSYLLITEYIGKRILRVWLTGEKANSSELFANINGNPDNIKRTVSGDFWVAVTSAKLNVSPIISTGQRINQMGQVVETRNFTAQYIISPNGISEVQQYNDKLYVGSLDKKFIGVDDV